MKKNVSKVITNAIQNAMDNYSQSNYRVECNKLERFYNAKVYSSNPYDQFKNEPLFELGLCTNGQILSVNGIIFPWILKNIQMEIYKDFNAYDDLKPLNAS